MEPPFQDEPQGYFCIIKRCFPRRFFWKSGRQVQEQKDPLAHWFTGTLERRRPSISSKHEMFPSAGFAQFIVFPKLRDMG